MEHNFNSETYDSSINHAVVGFQTYDSSINHAVVGFQTYLSTRVVIPRYNQKGPEIRQKLFCSAHCIHFVLLTAYIFHSIYPKIY